MGPGEESAREENGSCLSNFCKQTGRGVWEDTEKEVWRNWKPGNRAVWRAERECGTERAADSGVKTGFGGSGSGSEEGGRMEAERALWSVLRRSGPSAFGRKGRWEVLGVGLSALPLTQDLQCLYFNTLSFFLIIN